MTAIPGRNASKANFDIYHGSTFIIRGTYYDETNQLFLHLDWPSPKFTPSVYKEGLLAVKAVLDGAKKSNIPYVYTFVPARLVKFEQMFGFEPDSIFTGWPDDEPLYLMKQDTSYGR